MEFLEYFKQHYHISTPADVTWAHAVNDRARLEKVLQDKEIMVIEFDIQSFLGTSKPVIAHNFNTPSKFFFNQFIDLVKESNKGLKCDIKSQRVVMSCLEILARANLHVPIILNADILTAPGGWQSPFNPDEFIALCHQKYPQALLSLGWKTSKKESDYYRKIDIDRMLSITENLDEVTFPIRACLLKNSWNDVQRLVEKDGRTLTIWNNEPLSPELLAWIKANTDPKRTFYDLIDEQKNPIFLT